MNPLFSYDAMSSFTFSFERDFALMTEMGIRHAGLLVTKLAGDPRGCMKRLEDAGIGCTTLIVGGFNLADRTSWDATRAAHREAIDLVASISGHSIYFTSGRTVRCDWSEDVALLTEAVAPTVAYGRERGVIAAFEPTLRTSVSFVTTLRDAIDVAQATGLKIVADFGNMWAERDLAAMWRPAMPHIALLQICDVPIGGSGRPPMAARAHIGEGELPLARFMQDVMGAGYRGVFDLEVVDSDITRPTDETALRRGIAAASALLDEAGI